MSQWSFRPSPSLGVAAVAMLLLVALAPTSSAEEPAEFDPAMVDLYVADGALTLEEPDSEDTQSGSMLDTATTPATAVRSQWGGMTLAAPVKFETNMVATLWVEPEEATVIRQIRASILSGGERVAFGDIAIIGTSGESVFTEGRKIQIGIPTQGIEIDGDITLEFSIWATGVAGSPTDVLMLYGSTENPSRLSVGVSQDSVAALVTSGFARTYYLDDETLTPEPPTAEESSTRSHGVTGLENAATTEGFEWGTVTLEEDLKLIGDTTLSFWLTHSGDPALARTIRPEVHLGGTTVTQTAGINPWYFVNGDTYRYDLAFDTAGMELEAGDQIQVDFLAWSTNSDELGQIDYLYGSTVHPAGLTLRAAGDPPGAGPGLPSLNLTAPETQVDLSPGNATSVEVTLENPEQANATVDWNATAPDGVTVEFPDGENLSLEGEEAVNASVTFVLSPETLIGSTHTVDLSAEVDGVSVANLTFTITVVEGAGTDGSGGDGNGDGAGQGPGDGTQNQDSENEEEGFLPAPGFVAFALVALLGGLWVRSRRDQH